MPSWWHLRFWPPWPARGRPRFPIQHAGFCLLYELRPVEARAEFAAWRASHWSLRSSVIRRRQENRTLPPVHVWPIERQIHTVAGAQIHRMKVPPLVFRAGSSKKTARRLGAQLLANVNVRKALNNSLQPIEEQAEINRARVLQEIGKLAFCRVIHHFI
jgi:Terminase small subunit